MFVQSDIHVKEMVKYHKITYIFKVNNTHIYRTYVPSLTCISFHQPINLIFFLPPSITFSITHLLGTTSPLSIVYENAIHPTFPSHSVYIDKSGSLTHVLKLLLTPTTTDLHTYLLCLPRKGWHAWERMKAEKLNDKKPLCNYTFLSQSINHQVFFATALYFFPRNTFNRYYNS